MIRCRSFEVNLAMSLSRPMKSISRPISEEEARFEEYFRSRKAGSDAPKKEEPDPKTAKPKPD